MTKRWINIGAVVLALGLITTACLKEARPVYATEAQEPTEVIVAPQPVEVQPQSLGQFTLTAYCPCEECSEEWSAQTASGKKAKAGRTIAVDKKVIPFGTIVIINGQEYIAEDVGGAIKGKKIDVYFNSHFETENFGVQVAEVFIKP